MIQRLLSSQNARAFSISSASQSRCSEPLPLSRRSVSYAFSSAPRLRRANPANLPLPYYARLYGRVRRRPASVLPSTFEPQTQMASLGGEGERGGERQEEGGIDDAKSLMRRAQNKNVSLRHAAKAHVRYLKAERRLSGVSATRRRHLSAISAAAAAARASAALGACLGALGSLGRDRGTGGLSFFAHDGVERDEQEADAASAAERVSRCRCGLRCGS